eukprot:CAMPEP_0113879318 /NCGR_PEP_ID=MMETSP0780_2-20120614/7174_1 /TAXON_ID=652834 /ORGANISM="Palpitomonas bilix" /LENGTH=404 /DNA_ID=CAMNT_0000865891 /DNA_START=302 /DNA_END=1516 /DNA_ORIENTATION=- /assembly_acc=CAM_ASM_000599
MERRNIVALLSLTLVAALAEAVAGEGGVCKTGRRGSITSDRVCDSGDCCCTTRVVRTGLEDYFVSCLTPSACFENGGYCEGAFQDMPSSLSVPSSSSLNGVWRGREMGPAPCMFAELYWNDNINEGAIVLDKCENKSREGFFLFQGYGINRKTTKFVGNTSVAEDRWPERAELRTLDGSVSFSPPHTVRHLYATVLASKTLQEVMVVMANTSEWKAVTSMGMPQLDSQLSLSFKKVDYTLASLGSGYLVAYQEIVRDDPSLPCSYIVKKGDTLSSIARKFGARAMDLYALNNDRLDASPDSLVEGSLLRVGRSYTTKQGDTLERIAAYYGSTVQKMIAANGFHTSGGSGLASGQEVCIVPDLHQVVCNPAVPVDQVTERLLWPSPTDIITNLGHDDGSMLHGVL